MKNVLALVAVCGFAAAANAQTNYADATLDVFDNPPDAPYDHLDIASVDVNHDATNLYFSINLRGNSENRDWGKYAIAINAPGGVDSSGNGWGRNISWGGTGIDFWIASWVDGGGGGEVRQQTEAAGNGNNLLAASYGPENGFSRSFTGTQVNFVIPRALLGLTGNDTFLFDAVTSGGDGTPGVDHLSNANLATSGWGTQSTAGSFRSYTIPTPGAMALLGLGGLIAARRRRA